MINMSPCRYMENHPLFEPEIRGPPHDLESAVSSTGRGAVEGFGDTPLPGQEGKVHPLWELCANQLLQQLRIDISHRRFAFSPTGEELAFRQRFWCRLLPIEALSCQYPRWHEPGMLRVRQLSASKGNSDIASSRVGFMSTRPNQLTARFLAISSYLATA